LQTGEGREGGGVARTKHALKDALRLRAMHRLQDRLQKTGKEEVQRAASADAGVTDSLASSNQLNLESSLMDKGARRRAPRRRRKMNKSLKGKGRRRRRKSAAKKATTKTVAVKSPGGVPFTWVKGKRGWSTGQVCHVDSADVMKLLQGDASPDTTIRGFWRMVASSTHGASFKIETGFNSKKTESTSKESERSFSSTASHSASTTVSASIPVPIPLPIKVSVDVKATATAQASATAGGSSSIASTMAATMGQSKKQMISVVCPDEQMSTRVTKETAAPNNTALTTHSSLSLEYVYQWVVGNADYEAKTQHFRCHRVADGVAHMPQCAPQFCGNPFQNPYCVRFGSTPAQAGADPRCTR